MLGGGMRQAGMLAAAGIYALEHHVQRLEQDHANAQRLAQGLASLNFGSVEAGIDANSAQTNMLFWPLGEDTARGLADFLAQRQIKISPAPTVRLVTHLDVDAAAIDRFVAAVGEFFD